MIPFKGHSPVWSDQHDILEHRQEKSPNMRQWSYRFRRLLAKAKAGDTSYMDTVLGFPTAEAQYSALMQYHRVAGTVGYRNKPPHKVTLEDRTKIYNMRMNQEPLTKIAREIGCSHGAVSLVLKDMGAPKRTRKLPQGVTYIRRRLDSADLALIQNMRVDGMKISDIAAKLGSTKTNVSRVLRHILDFSSRKHDPLTENEIGRIQLLRLSGASLRDIAEKMGRTHSTIKYQVDRLNLVSDSHG